MDYTNKSLTELLRAIIYDKYDLDDSIDINAVYVAVNKKYCDSIGLDINKDIDRAFLYNWLKEKVGYDLLNEIIQETIDYLGEKNKNKHSFFLLENFVPLTDIIKSQINLSVREGNKNLQSLSYVPYEETEEMFIDYLKKIDPSLEWLNIYLEAKKQRKIVYLDEVTEEEKRTILHVLDVDNLEESPNGSLYMGGNQLIWLTKKYTIEDFNSLLHEFIHYVVNLKNIPKNVPHVLDEMPSIFYELYSHRYLLANGFSEEEINTLRYNRMQNSLYGASLVLDVFSLLSIYVERGKVDKEYLLDCKNKQLSNMRSLLNTSSMDTLLSMNKTLSNPLMALDKEWEENVRKMVTQLYTIHMWYPYVLDTYFANESLKNSNNYTISNMKYITENFAGLNVGDVLELMGVNIEKLGLTAFKLENELKY